jgi:acyl transferase domain-containing protein/thioesterase domain-containing protein
MNSSHNYVDELQAELARVNHELAALKQSQGEAIAVIGMDCRFPGGATNPEAYWHLLEQGIDATTTIPAERWDIEQYYSPDPEQPGTMYTKSGGFIREVDKFDPAFFSITPLEAAKMDPQQRLLLEVSYGALENAGLPIEPLKGSQTGVFLGICFDDYLKLNLRSGEGNCFDPYTSLGNTKSVAAGRLSYVFGFQGPNLALDTSCSSSLLAIHLACQSLRLGESQMALAGGVNLILSPEAFIAFSKMKALSAQGSCKTFDADADGYVRGEGCGIVVLKRLSDALADGNRIHAVIRGSAMNHDGRSNGLTAPNGLAQTAVIRAALENAQVEPSQIQYVEAHGTATTLGDPIEVLALGKVFSQSKSKDDPLLIGSVKTNFGHLEGAAGVASLMKVILSLQHKKVPPHLHLSTPNPYIPWDALPFHVPTETTPWHSRHQSALAGVSSFGMSGTNVHIVLEEAPSSECSEPSCSPQVLLLSAKTSSALRQTIHNLTDYLQQHSTVALADVAHTLQMGRQAFKHRCMVVAKDVEDAITKLQNANLAKNCTSLKSTKPPAVVFMFPGQGTQTLNMGLALYQSEPIFQAQVDQCAALLQPILGVDLREILYPQVVSEEALAQLQNTALLQPILFVFEYALAKLWMAWGIIPRGMIGHSLGEYVAACLSGVFSLEEALRLIAVRGQLMEQTPAGAMLAIALPVSELDPLLKEWKATQSLTLDLAAINGPSQCVVSGDCQAVEIFQENLLGQGITCRRLSSNRAFHSSMMEPILERFQAQFHAISLKSPQIPFISNVTGTWIAPEQATNATYWVEHLRCPVRFSDGIQTLCAQPSQAFLEVGPGQVLGKLIKLQIGETNTLVLASFPHLKPNPRGSKPTLKDAELQGLLTGLGQLWLAGVQIHWTEFHLNKRYQLLSLPTYPFERQPYWIEVSPKSAAQTSKEFSAQTSLYQHLITPIAKLHGHAALPLKLINHWKTHAKRHHILKTTLKQTLVEILEESLGVESIGVHDNFFDLGIDSLLAIELSTRLSKKFKVKLNQGQLIETPTIEMLASVIANTKNSKQSTPSSLVEIQPKGSKTPIFCIHPAGGNSFCYLNLVNYLGPDQPIYGIEDPNINQNLKSVSFQEKVTYYLKLIESVQPIGPYFLLGYSYGGNMAFEMAVQLKKQNKEVASLIMLDSFPPVSYKEIAVEDTRLLAAIWHMVGLMFNKKSRPWLDELKIVEPKKQLEYVLKQLQTDASGIALPNHFLNTQLLKAAMNNFRELRYNVPNEAYSGQITYFWAKEKIPESLSQLLNYKIPDDLLGGGWSQLSTQPVKTYFVPGHHFTMFSEANYPILATALKDCIDEAQASCLLRSQETKHFSNSPLGV